MRYFIDTEFIEDGRTIDLISIGIVREDGEEFYAEADMRPSVWVRILQHDWLMENVVPHLTVVDRMPLDVLADEIRYFTRCPGEPEFWAYCGAYDWVVLNQIFGSTVDHPSAWPFYCNDIAQLATFCGINRRKLPVQDTVKHHALADAQWTRDTYNWILATSKGRS